MRKSQHWRRPLFVDQSCFFPIVCGFATFFLYIENNIEFAKNKTAKINNIKPRVDELNLLHCSIYIDVIVSCKMNSFFCFKIVRFWRKKEVLCNRVSGTCLSVATPIRWHKAAMLKSVKSHHNENFANCSHVEPIKRGAIYRLLTFVRQHCRLKGIMDNLANWNCTHESFENMRAAMLSL